MEIPLPNITWTILKELYTSIMNTTKIDIQFIKDDNNPSIKIVQNIVMLKYKLLVETHGAPLFYPNVYFSHFKGIGIVNKTSLTPSTIGEIDSSFKLVIHKDELPARSQIHLYVDFEIQINPIEYYKINFLNSDKLDRAHPKCRILCSNDNNFPLENIPIEISKDYSQSLSDVKIFVLDSKTHKKLDEVDPIAIRKGDEYIKWYTSINRQESILFLIESVFE